MNERVYYSAAEIAQMLGVNMGKAYKILREMNQELAARGYLTIAGKIPVEYFKEKWYGTGRKVETICCYARVRRGICGVCEDYGTEVY